MKKARGEVGNVTGNLAAGEGGSTPPHGPVSVKLLSGILRCLMAAQHANQDAVFFGRDEAGHAYSYTWDDTVEAELLEMAEDLRRSLASSDDRFQRQRNPNVHVNERLTVHELRDLENWHLYRSRVWLETLGKVRKGNDYA